MNRAILGQRLSAMRKASGLSRSQIFEKYSVSARAIENWERGSAYISSIALAKYVKIFENYGIYVSLDKLLDFDHNFSVNVTVEVTKKPIS